MSWILGGPSPVHLQITPGQIFQEHIFIVIKQVAFSYCAKITKGSLLKISRSLWDLLWIDWQAALQLAKKHIYLIRQEPFNRYSWVGSKWRTLPIWILTLMQYPELSAYPKWDLKNYWALGTWRTAMWEGRQCWSAAAYSDTYSLWSAAHDVQTGAICKHSYLPGLNESSWEKIGLITAWLENNFLKWHLC